MSEIIDDAVRGLLQDPHPKDWWISKYDKGRRFRWTKEGHTVRLWLKFTPHLPAHGPGGAPVRYHDGYGYVLCSDCAAIEWGRPDNDPSFLPTWFCLDKDWDPSTCDGCEWARMTADTICKCKHKFGEHDRVTDLCSQCDCQDPVEL